MAEEAAKVAAVVAEESGKVAIVVAEKSKTGFAAASQQAAVAGAVIKEESSKAATALQPRLSLVANSIASGSKKAASTVIEETKKAAITVAEFSEKTIADLNSVPTEIKCGGCQTDLKVPSSVFDWICVNEHSVTLNTPFVVNISPNLPTRLWEIWRYAPSVKIQNPSAWPPASQPLSARTATPPPSSPRPKPN
jgi:hypothetical protein